MSSRSICVSPPFLSDHVRRATGPTGGLHDYVGHASLLSKWRRALARVRKFLRSGGTFATAGGTGGMGRASARLFAQEGAIVFAAARRPEPRATLVAEIRAAG